MCKHRSDPISELDELLDLLITKVVRDVMGVLSGKLNASQFAVLKFLRQKGPSTATGIAEMLQVTPGGATVLTDRLVDGGLVERTRDSDDRRVVWIGLTDKGRELSLELERLKRSMVERYVEGLKGAELRALNAVIRKILGS